MGNEHSSRNTTSNSNKYDNLRTAPYDPHVSKAAAAQSSVPAARPAETKSSVPLPQPKRKLGDKVSYRHNDGTTYLSTIVKVARREYTNAIAYVVSPDGFDGAKDAWINEDDANTGPPNWSIAHNQERVNRDRRRRPPGCKCGPDFECVCALLQPRVEALQTGKQYVNPDVPNRPNVPINPALATAPESKYGGKSKEQLLAELTSTVPSLPPPPAATAPMAIPPPAATVPATGTPANSPLLVAPVARPSTLLSVETVSEAMHD